MKRSKIGLTAVAFALLSAGMAGSTFAQNQPGGNGNGGGRGNRGGGNFDPAQMRAQLMERLKGQLGASDEEWKVLEPKVEKVMTASRAASANAGRFGGGRGGPGGPGGGGRGQGGGGGDNAPTPPATPLAQAAQELRTTAENKASTPEECAQKLAAFRAAREKARTELTAAQKELKELLTPKQEAILVASGTLE